MMFRRIVIFILLLLPGRSFALLDSIAVSGNPSPMTISTATAGSNPNSVSDSSTTYSVSTILASRKITGQLNSNMPSGTSLLVELEAPSGATSQGQVNLSTTASDLVNNVQILVLQSGLQITYTLQATAQASPAGGQNRTVTFTIL